MLPLAASPAQVGEFANSNNPNPTKSKLSSMGSDINK